MHHTPKDLITLHLSLISNVGPETVMHLFSRLPVGMSSVDLYSMSATDIAYYTGFTQTRAEKIVTGLADKKVLEQELMLVSKYAISWITQDTTSYPSLLKSIIGPPLVVYMRGAPLLEDDKKIAIIGSRKANQYGQSIIRNFVPSLVANGWTIVSGGALGADSMAHQEALHNQGKTIAVLGSGLLRLYPSQNIRMFEKIVASGGTLLSSFPVTMQALPGNFPARNRIISGLCKGCVVVQAAKKSGASITAHYALDQGRDVFAVPGPINDELSAGCHALIQQGALLTTSATEIMEQYNYAFAPNIVRDNTPIESPEPATLGGKNPDLTGIQQDIWRACTMPVSIDELLDSTGLSLVDLQHHLFSLQLEGHIKQDFMGMWQQQQ